MMSARIKRLWQSVGIRSGNPSWPEYLFLFLLFGTGILFYEYIDFRSLTVWSVSLLDCVADGNLYDFYAVVHENIHGAPHPYCGYNYIILIPWAIWNIPIWILQRFLGMEIVEHTGMLMWSRLFLILMLGIVVYFSRRIVGYFTDDSRVSAWTTFLLLAFPFTFLGVIIAGQSDIIVIAVTVAAVYWLLQGKQWVFILLMSVSISAKPFFIFSYIAVILLIEKNIFKAAGKIACSAVLMLLFNLIYAQAPLYAVSMENSTAESIVLKMIVSGVNTLGGVPTSFVVVGLFLVYFLAYCYPYDPGEKEKKYYILYMSAVPMLLYMAFAGFEFYRMLYLVPFLMLVMAANARIWRINLLLEKILGVTSFFMVLYGKYTVYVPCANLGLFRRLGYTLDVSGCRYENASELLVAKCGEMLPFLRNVVGSLLFTVIVLLAVVNLPAVSRRLPRSGVKCERWLYWIDLAVSAAFLGILFMLCFNMFS